MKNKLITILLAICLICTALFVFTACSNNSNNTDNRNDDILTIYNTYVAYAESNGTTPLSYEDWLSSIKGEKGEDGIGIESVWIDENGHLNIKYTDGRIKDLGLIKQPEQTYSQGLKFELNQEQTGYILTGIGTCNDRKVVIPSEYNGKPVVAIGYRAFWYEMVATEIVIPNSVKYIENQAFDTCVQLTSIVIPNSVESIGDEAFCMCYRLASVVIGDSVTSIGHRAFYGCDSLTSIVIPDSVTSIGEDAFSYCDSLVYNIKGGLKYLGNSTNKYLYLADTQDSSITIAEIDNNCRFIGDWAFHDCSLLTSIVIPDSVKSIGYKAFSGCNLLTSVEVGDSVTSIGKDAFYDCYSLTSIVIPDSVTSIGENAFYHCLSLTIYCEAESQPSGWDSDWNMLNRPVVWGYKG